MSYPFTDVVLRFEQILSRKTDKVVALFLPDGYSVSAMAKDIFRTCSIVKDGETDECAHASFFYSNGWYIRFFVEDTPTGHEFRDSLRALHGIVDYTRRNPI